MMDAKNKPSFRGADDVLRHADAAIQHLKELSVACANGDKPAARKALRKAISELQLGRAMLPTGVE